MSMWKKNLVKYLVEHGTNINEIMKDRNTALMIVFRYNQYNMNRNIKKNIW